MVVHPYPHIILRENKMIFGAHADRLQQGMRRSFGTAIGTAAKVEVDQTIITVKVKAGQEANSQRITQTRKRKTSNTMQNSYLQNRSFSKSTTEEGRTGDGDCLSAKEKELVLWFEDVRNTDVPIVGGKNASLGEMINAGLPVPPGFAVTAYSYERYIEEKQIAEQIYKIIKETVTNPNDPKQYDTASKKIRELIEKTPMPKDIENCHKSSLQRIKQAA